MLLLAPIRLSEDAGILIITWIAVLFLGEELVDRWSNKKKGENKNE
jgi:hypothetical protein